MKSKVYFSKVEPGNLEARIAALKRLCAKIGPFLAYDKDEIVPVKITIGDTSCVYHMSPGLVALVVREMKKKGAKPFLFDTSVIYKGGRHNAVDHLALAGEKGFGYEKVGAPFIIADGLLGQDGKEHRIDAPHIKNIRIPSFIGMVDSLLVLSHATGHIVAGYGGAIKNVAMGMSCKATKQVQHSSLKPSVSAKKCASCGQCVAMCPVNAIALESGKARIDQKICVGCGECLCACKFDAVGINWHEDPEIFCRRMVEVAQTILAKFKKSFFINFAFDITRECDCISKKGDEMAAKDIGIFASSDIVSVDRATVDAAYADKISDYLPRAKKTYQKMLEYAAHKGLGNLDHDLIEL